MDAPTPDQIADRLANRWCKRLFIFWLAAIVGACAIAFLSPLLSPHMRANWLEIGVDRSLPFLQWGAGILFVQYLSAWWVYRR